MADRTPAKTIRALDHRDATHGRTCVLSGTQSDRIVPQHRQGGAGGRKDKHRLPNVLWIDSLINGHVESDPEMQSVAMAHGVKVPGWVKDVTLVPVYYAFEHAWFVLEGDGRREVPGIVALDMMLDVYGDIYLLWKAIADRTDRAMVLLGRAVGR